MTQGQSAACQLFRRDANGRADLRRETHGGDIGEPREFIGPGTGRVDDDACVDAVGIRSMCHSPESRGGRNGPPHFSR